MLIVYTVIALCALGHIGAKAEQHVIFEDVETLALDPEYFDTSSCRFITDQNTMGTNWTIVKKFPPETTGTVTMMGYSMGGYSIPTNGKMVWPFCEMVRNAVSEDYFISLDITFDSCPPEPGNYFQESYKPLIQSLPKGIPDNKYVVICEILFEERLLFKDNIYIETQTY